MRETTHRSTGPSLRAAALVAGLGLLLMAILAPIAEFGVFQNLVVPGDAAATTAHILAALGVFRLAIASLLIVAILDVVVAWALYYLFRPNNRGLSLLAACLRVGYAAVFVFALIHLLNVSKLMTGAGASFPGAATQVMSSLDAFRAGWDAGLVVFGLHLVAIGYLMLKSAYAARWLGGLLGALLILAGLGYVADSLGKILLPPYAGQIAVYTFVGEPIFMLWLFWKAIKGFDANAALASRLT